MNLFLAAWADTFMTKVVEFATSVGMRLLSALLILIIGFIVVGFFAKKVRKSSKMDPMLAKFADQARKSGLVRVEEWKITVDNFVTDKMAELA